MTIGSESRYAAFADRRAAPPLGAESMESVFVGMPNGRLLTTFGLDSGDVSGTLVVCQRPHIIDIARDKAWFLIP